jgi:hypothetical protein
MLDYFLESFVGVFGTIGAFAAFGAATLIPVMLRLLSSADRISRLGLFGTGALSIGCGAVAATGYLGRQEEVSTASKMLEGLWAIEGDTGGCTGTGLNGRFKLEVAEFGTVLRKTTDDRPDVDTQDEKIVNIDPRYVATVAADGVAKTYSSKGRCKLTAIGPGGQSAEVQLTRIEYVKCGCS